MCFDAARFIPPLWTCRNLLNSTCRRPGMCFGAVDQPMGAQRFLPSDWLRRWSWTWCWRVYEILRAVCDLTANLRTQSWRNQVKTAALKRQRCTLRARGLLLFLLELCETSWFGKGDSFIVYQRIVNLACWKKFSPSNIFLATCHRNSLRQTAVPL